MNLFVTLGRRRKVVYGALTLLLAAAVAACGMGLSALEAAAAQLAAVDEQYATIALVAAANREDLYTRLHDQALAIRCWLEDGTIIWLEDGRVDYSAAYLYDQAAAAPQVRRRATSGLLAAELMNGQSIASGSIEPGQYKWDMDVFPHAMCVLAVRCSGVRDGTIHFPPESMAPSLMLYYADMEIVGAPALHASYNNLLDCPLMITSQLYTADGSCPFEAGKTYLLRGFIRNWLFYRRTAQDGSTVWEPVVTPQTGSFHFTDTELYNTTTFFANRSYVYSPNLVEFSFAELQLPENTEMPDPGDPAAEPTMLEFGGRYTAPGEEAPPYWAEYTGDWQDFLNTAEGAVWRDELIPWTLHNQNSVQVVLTDDVMTTYNFNTGAADILEGRLITGEEYAAGTDVCLVSAYLAQANGWQVGDAVELDLCTCYHTKARFNEDYDNGKGGIPREFDFGWHRLPFSENDRIGVQKSYTIVGIYTAPEYALGAHNFTAETVFVPKASVPNAEAYDNPNVDFCNALLLENGSQEAVEAYMESLDLGGRFVYFDQGYAEAKAAAETLRTNAQRLCALGLGALVLALAVGTLLQRRQLAPAVLGLRRMGVAPAAVVRMALPVQLALAGAAAVLGAGLAGALYGTLTQKLLGQTAALSLPGLLAGAALGFAAQLGCGWLCLRSLAKRAVM